MNGSAHGQRSAVPSRAGGGKRGVGMRTIEQRGEGEPTGCMPVKRIRNGGFGPSVARIAGGVSPRCVSANCVELTALPRSGAEVQCASSQLCGGARIDRERHRQRERRHRRLFHDLLHHRQRLLDLVVRHLEHEFVVHLQQHLRVQLLLGERCVHAHHGAADDVGGGALQARIDRRALVEGADRRVGVRRSPGSGTCGRTG